MAFTLPPLPYAPDALEPYIDKMTMEIHHGKHHNAYVTNLNKALESAPDLASKTHRRTAGQQLRDRAGRHPHRRPQQWRRALNHSMFWTIMAPAGRRPSKPSGALADAINSTFGSFDDIQGEIQCRRRHPVRFRLGMAAEERREAGDYVNRQSGQPAHGRQECR